MIRFPFNLNIFGFCVLFFARTTGLCAQTISYIIPDIGTSGQNTYVEIIGPANQNHNFGTDGFYSNNPGDAVRLVCANINDTSKVIFGPLVVSWNGKMISTQVFVVSGVISNSTDWQQLAPAYKIPVQVLLNGVANASVDTFYIVQPLPPITISDTAVLGSGGALGVRSRRGAMVVSSLHFQAGANVTVSTADCDPYTPGNQGYLPVNILATGNVVVDSGANVSVSALGGQIPDAGPGGGGGGTESWTGNSMCGAGPNAAGAGFTGGGTELHCCFEIPGAGTGVGSTCLGCGKSSLNGVLGGAGGTGCNLDEDKSGGGTGHPFGTSGGILESPGGYGGGTGWPAYAGGGYASAGTSPVHSSSAGQINGNKEMIPFAGGSGGCGGVAGAGTTRGGGGGGGGAINLYAFNALTLAVGAEVQSNGGAGVLGANSPPYRGGAGGSGGGVMLGAKLASIGAGTTEVAGGIGGIGASGQAGNGGAGRVRVDGPFSIQPVILPAPGTGSSTFYKGPSTDTSSYVSRMFNLTGTGNGKAINIYLKPQGKPWILATTVTGYTNNWIRTIILPCPDTTFFLVAAEQITNPSASQYIMEPSWSLSQAAANFLFTGGQFVSSGFTADSVCLNLPTQFTAGSIGNEAHWLWNFGDNNSSVLQNPDHIYLAAGNYHVTLSASDSVGCSDTSRRTIIVYPLPVAAFTVTPACLNNQPMQFVNQSIESVQWNWKFGDSTSSTLQNPAHSYKSAGTYSDTLIAISVYGCVDTLVRIVSVYAVPVASFYTVPTCLGGGTSFTNTSMGSAIYNWRFGDGDSSSMQNPTHTYASLGNFNVTLTVTSSNDCSDTSTESVVINGRSIAVFDADNVCLHDTTLFTNITDTSIYSVISWNWSFGDGTVPDHLTSPGHLYQSAGTYTATLVAVFAIGCTDTAALPITVYSLPTVVATIVNDSCFGKKDGSIRLTAGTGLTPFIYSWSNGFSGAENTALGCATYVVTITDARQCLDSASYIITQPSQLQADTTVMPITCYGLDNGNILITDTGGSPPYSYTWNTGSHSANLSNLAPGTYMVTVSDFFGCSLAETVIMNQTPEYLVLLDSVETISLGENIQLVPTTLNGVATSWLWTPDNFLSCAECSDPVAQPYTTYTYFVQSTSSKGCEASGKVTINIIPTYSIYIPNAFTPNGDGNDDLFQVFGNKNVWKFFSIQIFDRWGEKVFESGDMSFQWDGTYKGKPLPPNVYVYQIHLVYADNHTDELFKGGITLLR